MTTRTTPKVEFDVEIPEFISPYKIAAIVNKVEKRTEETAVRPQVFYQMAKSGRLKDSKGQNGVSKNEKGKLQVSRDAVITLLMSRKKEEPKKEESPAETS